jgi:hypothetical protein
VQWMRLGKNSTAVACNVWIHPSDGLTERTKAPTPTASGVADDVPPKLLVCKPFASPALAVPRLKPWLGIDTSVVKISCFPPLGGATIHTSGPMLE